MTRALVLSGGGARGAFQAGVLRRWVEKYPDLDYDFFCGTSAGAINAAVLAHWTPWMGFRDAAFALEKFWRTKIRSNSDIYRPWPAYVPALWKDSVYSTRPLQKLLEGALKGQAKQCWVCATDIVSGELSYFNNNDPFFVKAVQASASFPAFFPPVKIADRTYIDGATVHNIILGKAIRAGADEIDMVLSSNPWEKFEWNGKRGLLGYLRRTLDIMTEQMTKSDVEITGFKNDLADRHPSWERVKVQTCVFTGSQRYDALDFDGKKIDEMLDAGYNQALDVEVIE